MKNIRSCASHYALACVLVASVLGACGGGGSSSPSVPAPPNPPAADITPPSVPADLQGSYDAAGQGIVLTWTASTDDRSAGVASYEVIRDGIELARVTTTTYIDTSATAGVTYSYAVRAVDASNNESAASAGISVMRPVVPTGALTPAAHPRLWITPERLANLRAHVGANTVQWQAVKARADAQVARGTAFTGDADEYALGDLGMACVMTTDARYAQRAASVLSQYAVSTNTLQRDSAYDYRYIQLAAMALDWCHSALPENVRKQTATWLMDRADWVWPETNPPRSAGWGVASAPNNYFWGFMMTGVAALAAYGEDVGVGPVSGANRPAYHIDLAKAKWTNLVTPFINGWARGGVFAEGTNYESTRPMALLADAFHTSLGDDTYIELPFFKALYRWQLQQVAPNGQHYVYLGEQARDSEGGIIYYERTHHLILAAFPGVATAAERAVSYRMVSQWPLDQNSSNGLTALDMIFWDQSVAPATDNGALPQSFIDPTTGVVVHRTSHTDPGATLLFFEAGPLLESHQLFNANGLMIWKNGYWVLGHGQMWDREYDLGQSSTLHVEGVQQTWQEETRGGGQLLSADANDAYLYVAGEAKDAYGRPGNRPLTSFVRKAAYLADIDAVVVVDRVGKTAAATSLEWRWWARPQNGPPSASGSTYSFGNRDNTATLYGQNLIGGTSTTAVATGTGSYYVRNTSSSGTTSDLAAMAMRLGVAPNASSVNVADRVHVRLANWLVSFAKAETAVATLTVETDASRFLVSDLTPLADYRANDAAGSVTIRASASGVAFFTLGGSATTRQVTLARQ